MTVAGAAGRTGLLVTVVAWTMVVDGAAACTGTGGATGWNPIGADAL